MSATRENALQFVDLGRISYADAWEKQLAAHQAILDETGSGTIFLLEHDPVITVTQRDGAFAHLLSNPQMLRRDGIEVVQTNRGGDITYHGPGQLIAYPILPLQPLRINVRQYIGLLEEAIIEAIARFGIEGRRDEAGIGVWTEHGKIAAIGVRVRRWITLHGLALNVTTHLDHFQHIVPCGLPKPVTSLKQLLKEKCPAMHDVKHALCDALQSRFAPANHPSAP